VQHISLRKKAGSFYSISSIAVLSFLALGMLYPFSSFAEDTSTSTPKKHIVRTGNTLAKIAHRYYGDGKLYPVIAEANKLADPHLIITGQVLVIPAYTAPQAAAAATVVPVIAQPNASVMAPSLEGPLSLAEPPFIWRQEPYNLFGPGEKLTFAVRWKFITVGYATMEIDNIEDISGRKAYHIVTNARSAPFFDTFYKVRDINESWMDVESLCSLKYASHIRENDQKKDETILLNHIKRQYQVVESGQTGEIPLWVQDVLSSLYYLRTKNLVVGEKYSIDAHTGDKSWPLNVTVIRREKIKVPAGEFDCFVVEPSIREGAGIFQAKGKLLVWMTADDKKVPVLMRSSIAVGAIEAQLLSMQLK
jgi:hypothetical protein